MPTLTSINNRAQSQAKQRTAERDTRIRRMEPSFVRVLRPAERELKGLMAESGQEPRELSAEIDAIMAPLAQALAANMRGQLEGLLQWSVGEARGGLQRLRGTRWWARHLLPDKVLVGTEAMQNDRSSAVLEDDAATLDAQNELLGIINGDITGEEARAKVEELLIPPPTPEEVDKILTDTSADDGLSAMERVVTIVAKDLPTLKETLVSMYSGGEKISAMASTISEQFGQIHWKSMRIARTEGIRIAERTLRDSWDKTDVVDGLIWNSALLPSTADFDRSLDGQVFIRAPDGSGYFGRGGLHDGLPLPNIPIHPNGLCWTSPFLSPAITQNLPPVDLGAGHAAAQARAERGG